MADREITARVIGHDMISAAQAEGEKRGLDRAMAEIRAHLGEPTPEERAAVEALAFDVSEEGIDPEGDDYALRLVQRINAWMDSDDDTIAGRRAALLECAAVAIAGIVAGDAAAEQKGDAR